MAEKIDSPLEASPALATVDDDASDELAAAAGALLADASLLAAAIGADDAVASVELELVESAGFEQPVTSIPPNAATATNEKNFDCMDAPFLFQGRIPTFDRTCTGRYAVVRKQRGVSRISIRFAKPYDAKRFEADGVVSGPLPAGESSSERVAKWRIEEAAGRRAILVAQETSGLFGMVHVIFQFPPGYRDAEAANGQDIAMIESLSTRIRVPAGVSDALMNDAQIVAKRQRVKTLTLCLPLADDRAILQAKSWMFAFFRKPL